MAQCGRRGGSIREEMWLSLGGEVAQWREERWLSLGGDVAQFGREGVS